MKKAQIRALSARKPHAATLAIIAALACLAAPATAKDTPSDLAILESYAADFEKDPGLVEPVVFGVKVGKTFYTVEAAPAKDAAPAQVGVRPGAPSTPAFYFTVESSDWLGKLYRGEVNALTSMAKAFETDYAPMDIDVMEGFAPPEDFGDAIIPFTFHF